MVDSIKDPSMNDPHKIPGQIPEKTDKQPKGEISEAEAFHHTSMDPSGLWAKFLSNRGTQQITEEDVKVFLKGLEKMLQIAIQQNDRAFKRSIENLKNSGQG